MFTLQKCRNKPYDCEQTEIHVNTHTLSYVKELYCGCFCLHVLQGRVCQIYTPGYLQVRFSFLRISSTGLRGSGKKFTASLFIFPVQGFAIPSSSNFFGIQGVFSLACKTTLVWAICRPSFSLHCVTTLFYIR